MFIFTLDSVKITPKSAKIDCSIGYSEHSCPQIQPGSKTYLFKIEHIYQSTSSYLCIAVITMGSSEKSRGYPEGIFMTEMWVEGEGE